jgi:hypothetical protein
MDQALVVFRRLLGDGEATTGCGVMRGSRERDRRPRSFPGEGERFGWRCAGAGELQPSVRRVDLLQNKIEQGYQKVRRVVENWIEERGRAQAHRRRRIRRRMAAASAGLR